MEPTRRTTLEKCITLLVLSIVICLPVAAAPFYSHASSTVSSASLVRLASTLPATVVGTNVPIVGEASPDRQQVEPTIAIDPHNTNIIVAGAQDLRLVSVHEHRWLGYYRSTDGGTTWTNVLLPGFPGDTSPQGLVSPLRRFNATSDPVLAFDRQGNLYYAGLGVTATPNGILPTGLFVAKFTNDGAVYSNTTLISAGITPDKPWIAVDTTGNAFDGNVYLAYDANLTATSYFGTLFTRSTDGGRTWSTPFYAPADETGELPGVAIDASGNVYVSADAFDAVTEAFLGYIEVTKITNGGTTVAGTTRAVNPANIIPSPLPGGSFRTFTIPQMAADKNGVYLVWDSFPPPGCNLCPQLANVLFTRSTDGGATWTSPLMVNDATTGHHFFPTVVAAGGIISVAWYDSRFNSGSTLTALDVFYAQSLDGGVSFSSNVRVTPVSFNPELVERTDFGDTEIFMGDYIEIAATPAFAQVIWSDNRNACDTIDPIYGCVDQDAYTATIGLPDFAISASPSSQTILQGSSGNVKVSLTSVNGFQANVTVTASSSPPGLPVSPVSKTIQVSSGGIGSFNLTFSPNGATVPGLYTVNITGTSGPRSHFALTTIVVQTSSVGGGLVGVDRLRLLIELLKIWTLLAVAITVGTASFLVWLRRSRIESRSDDALMIESTASHYAS
ncbi:hypothetical protein AUF62_03000 [archaeon 13_1_20CM_52_20]|nr:MAG: hypothetical protein AUF62_03000 [archaeon 13_1_20CM_52_20]